MLRELINTDTVSAETAGLPVHQVPLTSLVDNSYQPRQHNDPDHVLGIARSLLALAGSLPETRGLQQLPIGRIVRWADSQPIPAAAYQDSAELRRLIADPQHVVEMAFGHSRRLAFECLAYGPAKVFPEVYAGVMEQTANIDDHDPAAYEQMPVILLPLTNRQMWQHAVTENAQRRDISAIEEAATLRQAIDAFGLTVEEAGRTLGKSRGAASNLLRLLDLPDEYQGAIINGILSETHGRALLALKPAMHLLRTPIADLGAMTRRELEQHIAHVIAACQPIAPGPRTGYRSARYSYNNTSIATSQFDPPAWPLDWQPGPADGIVGPCNGCQWRATFAGDPGPRCTHTTKFAGGNTCYDLKTHYWQAQQIAQQRQAIEARQAAVAATSAAGAHTSTAPAHTSIAASADVSQETPTAPDAPVYTPTNTTEVTWFTTNKSYWGQAPAVLHEKGLCSAGKCKCFVLAYKATLDGSEIRPDADSAPNMCYGCTSPQRLARRKQELEHGDMAAKRAAIKSENAACEELLRDAFYRLTAQDLWHNSQFMRHLLKAGSLSNGLGQRNIDILDALEIQDWIWRRVARERCCNWSQFTVDGETQHWSMDKVRAWLREIAAGFARTPGGVWAELAAEEQQLVTEF